MFNIIEKIFPMPAHLTRIQLEAMAACDGCIFSSSISCFRLAACKFQDELVIFKIHVVLQKCDILNERFGSNETKFG